MRRAGILFDSNAWEPPTRGLISSCCAELQALMYCVKRVEWLCENRREVCQVSVASLAEQWRTGPGAWLDAPIYAQCADLHVHVEALFGTLKSLLDLMSMLLHSEGVIGNRLEGFNKCGDDPGGRVLRALTVPKIETQAEREKIRELILDHKKLWIDEAISVRDSLTHPKEGSPMLMFQLEMAETGNGIECREIHVPQVDLVPIADYARRTLDYAEEFAKEFMRHLRK